MFLQPFSTTHIDFNNLPLTYILKKFYELGFFAQRNGANNTYSCSCPICREGDTGIGKIKRCYFLPDKNRIYCHRCGTNLSPINWIKQVSGMSIHEIVNEIKSGDFDYDDLNDDSNVLDTLISTTDNECSLPRESINLADTGQIEYFKKYEKVSDVVEYLNSRRLLTAINKPDAWYTTIKDSLHYGRLVIPFFDVNNKVIFYQSRDITNKNKIRFLSKINGIKSIFNINKIDYSLKSYFIFEGPFDACFVKNGVAIGGINPSNQLFNDFQAGQAANIQLERIWVLDSQHIDITSYEKTEILLKNGESVFIWPQSIGKSFKDFNELCIYKNIDEIPIESVLKNTYSGFEGLVQLYKIKKPS